MAITIDGSNGITQPDNAKLKSGNSDDLQIYHDGAHSIIKDNGTGDLKLMAGDDIRFQNVDGTKAYATFNENSSCQLHYDGVVKFATTSTGVDVIGDVTTDGLGVGTTSPAKPLHVYDVTANAMARFESGDPESGIILTDTTGSVLLSTVNKELRFYTNGNASSNAVNVVERMRIDSSGNAIFNGTAPNQADAVTINTNNYIWADRTSGNVCFLNRRTTGGDVLAIYYNGSESGTIGSNTSNHMYIGKADTGLVFQANEVIAPYNPDTLAPRDNIIDLGHSTARFDDIWATNGTIQTSDRNEKQDIAELDVAEQNVARACKGLLRKFRWQDAVAEKGDDARIHFGIIAQDLQDAFAAEGLDAGRYAMFISTTWWETQTEVPAVVGVAEELDADGNVITEAVEAQDAYTRTDTYHTLEEAPEGAVERTRLGVRYPELLAFIIAAL